MNAHDINELLKTWSQIISKKNDGPSVVIAHSVKGKGVSFMENKAIWHHGGINDEQFGKAFRELSIGLTQ